MKCLSCDRTLQAGGSSHPMAVSDIEIMFAELLGWSEAENGWRCPVCDSGSDRNGEDSRSEAECEASQSGGEAASPSLKSGGPDA